MQTSILEGDVPAEINWKIDEQNRPPTVAEKPSLSEGAFSAPQCSFEMAKRNTVPLHDNTVQNIKVPTREKDYELPNENISVKKCGSSQNQW